MLMIFANGLLVLQVILYFTTRISEGSLQPCKRRNHFKGLDFPVLLFLSIESLVCYHICLLPHVSLEGRKAGEEKNKSESSWLALEESYLIPAL